MTTLRNQACCIWHAASGVRGRHTSCLRYGVLIVFATLLTGCTGSSAPAPLPKSPVAAQPNSKDVKKVDSPADTSIPKPPSSNAAVTSQAPSEIVTQGSAPSDSSDSTKKSAGDLAGDGVDSPAKSSSTETEKARSGASEVSTDTSNSATIASSASSSKTESPAPDDDVNLFGREQILLLLPDGPVIVALRFSIDGRPHAMAFGDVVDDVLKQTDVDGDGKSTWEEVVASPRFRYGQAGNLETKDAGARQRMIRLDRKSVV